MAYLLLENGSRLLLQNATGRLILEGPTSFYLPYQLESALIPTANANPFGIDPDRTTPMATANTNPFSIDPEQTTLIAAGNTNPFDIDPEQTTLITVGLTAAD